MALDPEGNLYIADHVNHAIRRVDAVTGIITTTAGPYKPDLGDGGPATQAGVYFPTGLAFDADGNYYVAEERRIRRIDAETGIITTVVGSGDRDGFNGDGGLALDPSIFPSDVFIDPVGNILVAEGHKPQSINSFSLRVRRVDAETRIVTAIAGNGLARKGSAGDGGPATQASISLPKTIALDSAGNLFIADSLSSPIRVVYACVDVGPPGLSSPANGSSGLSASTALRWQEVPGAFRYDVYLDTDNPPQRIVARDIEPTSFALSGLEHLTTYYWRVVAKGDPYCDPFETDESEVRSFTTTSSCEEPGTFGKAKTKPG